VRYYGAYSNASRGKRKKAAAPAEPSSPDQAPEDAAIPDGPCRAAVRPRGKADVSARDPRHASTRPWAPSSPTGGAQVGLPSRQQPPTRPQLGCPDVRLPS
jgi:hypothetical protein